MSQAKSSISEQAEKYAEVIVGQIADNFQQLNDNVASCSKLKETLDEYKKAHKQSKWAKFIFEKNIDEYIGYVDEAKKETGCEDYNRIEPLAVGLFGEWGSGKTHQLKLIKHNILYPPKDIKFPQTTIPVFFNAWRFEKEEHIILPLFQTLLQAVEEYEFSLEEKGAKGYRTLSMYLKLGLLSLNKGLKVPDFISATKHFDKGEYKKAIDEIIDTSKISTNILKKIKNSIVGEQTLTELLQEDQLESIYLNIPQWIEKITLFENVNFVFLIDDLDRCLPENTLKMLESIKLFLDVPSCAFVLAVDDDVVERGVVHHYRDYLSIYHHKDTEGSQSVMQHELPITGHEYLEKMIQLPVRLPVIDVVNAKDFLTVHSQKWIEIVDNKNEAKLLDDKEERKDNISKESEKLLIFFANAVPAKPRKLIRTAKLFETKLKLLQANKLLDKVDMFFVAKLTLLDLFSPELLRFIQNNGYGLIFNILCHFRSVGYKMWENAEFERSLAKEPEGEPIEKYLNSLMDIKLITKYINTSLMIENDEGFTTKEKNLYTKAMKIVEKHFISRVTFDLDVVFEERYDTEKLKLIIEMQESKEKKELSRDMQIFTDEFITRLFRPGDVDAWKDVLKDNNAMIGISQLDELINKAKKDIDSTFNSLSFLCNPQWVSELAKYVDEEQYIRLLMASHDKRFKTDKKLDFEIDMFTISFSEYDKFCEITGNNMPKDEGWGRGRRPVIYVSWNNAQQYIYFLNKISETYKYSLPTIEQWRLAYSFKITMGERRKQIKYMEDRKIPNKTYPVGKRKSNPLGLYDMCGHVLEWCQDDYSDQKNAKHLMGSPFNSEYKKVKSYGFDKDSVYEDTSFRLIRTKL